MKTENILNDSRLRALENHTRVNLLRPRLGTTTQNGVTCTNNGDWTYTLNGTASGDCYFEIDGARSLWENKGLKYGKDYRLVGCPKGGSSTTYCLKLDGNTPTEWFDNGDGVVINYPTSLSSNIYNFCIYVKSGTTCNNLIFKPMLTTDLTATYDDFVSYDDSNITGKNINNYLDKIKFGASGGKNLLNPDIKTSLGMVKDGDTVKNYSTDTLTYISLTIRLYSALSLSSNFVDIGYNFTKISGYNYIYIKHNGAAADLGIWFDISNLEDGKTYILSFKQNGTNPSVVGGLVWRDFQIEEGDTATDYEPYIKSLKGLTESSLKMDLLWENASPTSSFAAQTINVPNLSRYSVVYVICDLYANYGKYICELFLNQTGRVYVLNAISDTGIGSGYPIASYYRFFSLNSDGIYFYGGIYGYDNVNTKGDSNTMIPYQIYGVK